MYYAIYNRFSLVVYLYIVSWSIPVSQFIWASPGFGIQCLFPKSVHLFLLTNKFICTFLFLFFWYPMSPVNRNVSPPHFHVVVDILVVCVLRVLFWSTRGQIVIKKLIIPHNTHIHTHMHRQSALWPPGLRYYQFLLITSN